MWLDAGLLGYAGLLGCAALVKYSLFIWSHCPWLSLLSGYRTAKKSGLPRTSPRAFVVTSGLSSGSDERLADWPCHAGTKCLAVDPEKDFKYIFLGSDLISFKGGDLVGNRKISLNSLR